MYLAALPLLCRRRCLCLCLSLPCLALPCLALPCLALPCLALPCLALPCLALPCLASPCLALLRVAFREICILAYLSFFDLSLLSLPISVLPLVVFATLMVLRRYFFFSAGDAAVGQENSSVAKALGRGRTGRDGHGYCGSSQERRDHRHRSPGETRITHRKTHSSWYIHSVRSPKTDVD